MLLALHVTVGPRGVPKAPGWPSENVPRGKPLAATYIERGTGPAAESLVYFSKLNHFSCLIKVFFVLFCFVLFSNQLKWYQSPGVTTVWPQPWGFVSFGPQSPVMGQNRAHSCLTCSPLWRGRTSVMTKNWLHDPWVD